LTEKLIDVNMLSIAKSGGWQMSPLISRTQSLAHKEKKGSFPGNAESRQRGA
jgi:hypothetical protein